MSKISASDLKKGISVIEALLEHQSEVIISVRGNDRFVVMDVAHYQYLRECELDAALAQTRADISAGRFIVEPAGEHAVRLSHL